MRSKLGIAAIVVFVLVDIVLVTLAFRHVRPAGALPSRPSALGASPSQQPTAAPSKDASPAAPRPARDSQPVYLSLAADGTVVRATRGDCTSATRPTAPRVEVSTGAGTFHDVPVGSELGVVLRVQSDSAGALWIVAGDTRCRVGVYRGKANSSNWNYSAGTDGAWHLLATSGREQVHSPTGVVETPCPPTRLSAFQGVVRVLCDDGRVVGTGDEGKSWVVLGRLEGAADIRYTSAGDGFAVARRPGCAAAALRTSDGGATWEQLGCLGRGRPRAIAAAGDVVIAQVGDTLFESVDSGRTWGPR